MKSKYWFVFLLCILISFICSITFFQDASYDFYAYHYYNGWAFLNNRIDIDLMPASYRSYFNPYLDAFHYLIMTKFDKLPALFMYFATLKLGIFLFISYILFDLVFKIHYTYKKYIVACAMILTILSPIILAAKQYDNVDLYISSLVLLALYLLIKYIYKDNSKKRYLMIILSGILAGAATGLKYSAISSVLALFICILANYKNIQSPIKTFLLMSFGSLAGFLITDGYWLYIVYSHFGNPFFPYFNNIFKSSMGNANPIVNSDFTHLRPHNLFKFIFLPFWDSSIIPNIGYEIRYFDLKIPTTFVVIGIILIMNLLRKTNEICQKLIDTKILNTIILYTALTYYINNAIFGQLRYILIVFPLSAVIIFSGIYLLSKTVNINLPLKFSPMFVNTLVITILTYLCIYYINTHNIKYFIDPIINIILGVILTAFIYCLIKHKQNKFIIGSLTFMFFYIFTLILPIFPFKWPNPNNIVTVFSNNIEIKDNSIVILASLRSNFIIPHLNPNAEYIGMSLPENLQKEDFYMNRQFVRSNYHSEYLANYIKEKLKTHKDIYLIYNSNEIGDNKYSNLPVIQKALKYYSEGKIKNIDNCEIIDRYYLFRVTPKKVGDFYVCKVQ